MSIGHASAMTLTFGRAPRRSPPEFGWRKLDGPDDELAFVLAIPVAATLCLALVVAWILATPWSSFVVDQARLLAALAIAVPVHELLRVAAFPRKPERHWLRFVCTKSRLALDTGFDGELPRARLLCVLAAPFLLGSVLPVALCAALRIAPDFAVLVTLTNALLCGGDALALMLVLAQVPGRRLVRVDADVIRWQTSLPATPARVGGARFAR